MKNIFLGCILWRVMTRQRQVKLRFESNLFFPFLRRPLLRLQASIYLSTEIHIAKYRRIAHTRSLSHSFSLSHIHFQRDEWKMEMKRERSHRPNCDWPLWADIIVPWQKKLEWIWPFRRIFKYKVILYLLHGFFLKITFATL